MKLEKIELIIALLRQNGVSHFKSGDFEIRFYSGLPGIHKPVVLSPIAEPGKIREQRVPATGAAVPPVEVNIPHHVNEVANLLKLSDEELVDKLFPDFTATDEKE